MPLTITLRRDKDDRAKVNVFVDGQEFASFEPAALRVNQPFTSRSDSSSRSGSSGNSDNSRSSDSSGSSGSSSSFDTVAYGRSLLAALGGPKVQELQERLSRLPPAPHLDSMVAIQTDDAELAAIPWEFLHDGKEFLIFRYLLVREVPATHAPPPPPTAQLWRLVVMGSDPLMEEQYDAQGKLCGLKPVPRLKVAWELDTLRDDLQQRQPPVPFRWQRIAPTRAALIDDLAASEPILFHFVGHGSVVNGTPMLCFDNGAGKLDPQPASDLAEQLRGMVMLAFLNACRTADSVEPGANLALTLVQHGIPVVVSNQYRVIDEAAAPVARTFYRFLAANMHPAQALYRARLQLKNHLRDQPVQWAIPVIYLMQGYQWPQCPNPPAHPLPPIEPPPPVLTALSAPDYQAGRFVGRERELYKLASMFVDDQKKIVTIRGPGGIGKTALVAALAHRLRFVFSDGIVALSLVLPGEQAGLNAADVRRQLARLLGIRVEESSAWPTDERDQETILVEHLQRRRRVLLIWDNYETVLWRLGRETDPDASDGVFSAAQRDAATAVQRLVRRLADSGMSMLFTSRQSPVGIPGEVCFPPLEVGQLPGLSAEASEDFMRRWISMRNPKEQFLHQLAAAVDHHPLAMQLAITRWDRGQDDEDTFLSNLDHELAQARDPAAPMYQQTSVEINIRLSLNALPNELREALLTLTIIANPRIIPLHAAVVWGLEDGQQWQIETAHRQLEVLQQTSLLQGIGYDPAHNRAQAYSLQPVIAGFLRREAQRREAGQTLDMNVARQRYARWAAMLVAQAHDPQQGINANPDLAQWVQFVLPDLTAALPALTDADRGWTYWQAAWVFARMGDLATAQRMIDLATPLAQTDEALLGRVYHQQADLLVTRGDLDQALELYQQSLDLTDRLGDVQGKAATLHQMANVFVTRGDLDQALELYQQSLDLFDRLGDVKGKAATLHAMAHVFVTRGDLDQALELYQQSLDLKDRLGDVQGKAATLHQMANVFVTRGDLDQALELYQQSLDLTDRLGDVQGKAATLHQMANVFVTRGDLDQALELYQQSLDLKDRLGDVQGKAATLHQMANVFVTRGDLDQALELYQQSLDLKDRLGDVQGKAATLHAMAHVFVTRGDLDQALELYQQSLDLKDRLGDVQGKAATLHAMAHVFVTRGDLAQALELYQQARDLFDRLGDVKGKAATLHAMAHVFVTRGDLDQALELYQQSLDLFDRLGDVQGKAATLHAMANVFVTRGDLDQALELYQQSLDLFDRLGDVQGKAATLHQMANVFVTRGDLDQALELYQQSLDLTDRLGDVQGKAATLHQMANVFVTRGDLDQALELYQQSLDLTDRLGDVQGKAATLHQMANVFVTRGDLDQALELYQQSLDLKDRLGDVQGKAATLLMMAQIMFMRGDQQQALQQAYAALQTLERIGAAPDAAKAREIIAQMEAARAQASGSAAAVNVTPARLLGMLIAMVVQARGKQIHPDQVRAALTQLPPAAPWPAVRDVLLAALDGTADAASHLLAAAPPLLAQGTAAERADALAGIGNLARLLSDRATERQAREAAVAAFRTAGDDRQSLISLSIALYNLAMCYVNQGEVAAAIPLLEEVVALDERTGHPDLAQDRATLEALRRHLAGLPEPTLVEAIMAWRNGNGDEAQFVALINRICNLYVRTMREGSPAQREELANDLAELRAAPALPIPGARDFLGVLQLRLRDEPGMAERAAQIRATLPAQWVDVLERMERDVAGEPVDTSASPMADNQMMAAAATLAAQLEQLPPAQRAEVQVLLQVTPLLIGAMALLNQDHADEQRTAFVQVLEQAADQAAAGEAEGSPWLKAAAVLRTLAGWLTGKPVNVDELAEPYRSVVQQMRGD
ncbi:MAG: hypothetical protein KatS3mg056_2070 [Chloroflexus sp.]|nr:MAG: hypothetical protein KatS3mg056_2070 [Chloroflexus sp.]